MPRRVRHVPIHATRSKAVSSARAPRQATRCPLYKAAQQRYASERLPFPGRRREQSKERSVSSVRGAWVTKNSMIEPWQGVFEILVLHRCILKGGWIIARSSSVELTYKKDPRHTKMLPYKSNLFFGGRAGAVLFSINY